MAVGTRWNSARLEEKLTHALEVAGKDLQPRYEAAAKRVANETHDRIQSSGRGGSHNGDFSNIETRVFRSGAKKWNVLVGWLHPAGDAHEKGSGGRLWYQYQDSGFRLFGGPNWQEGVMATVDQRYRLLDALLEENVQMLNEIKRALS